MLSRSCLLLFFIVTIGQTVMAEPTTSVTSAIGLVEGGFNAYQKDGAAAAIEAWLKGSAIEGSALTKSHANALQQIEEFYGKPVSFQVIAEQPISEKTTVVVFTINFQKGPLFGRMQAFQNGKGEWISSEFKFHTDATQVLPSAMVFGQ